MNIIRKLSGNKIILCIILSVFLICSVIYYFNIYFKSNQIVFTESDKFILIILGASIIIASTLVTYFSFKINKLSTILEDTRLLISNLQNDLAEIEDDNVNLHRTTQLMIMNLSRKLGVRTNEKGR